MNSPEDIVSYQSQWYDFHCWKQRLIVSWCTGLCLRVSSWQIERRRVSEINHYHLRPVRIAGWDTLWVFSDSESMGSQQGDIRFVEALNEMMNAGYKQKKWILRSTDWDVRMDQFLGTKPSSSAMAICWWVLFFVVMADGHGECYAKARWPMVMPSNPRCNFNLKWSAFPTLAVSVGDLFGDEYTLKLSYLQSNDLLAKIVYLPQSWSAWSSHLQIVLQDRVLHRREHESNVFRICRHNYLLYP